MILYYFNLNLELLFKTKLQSPREITSYLMNTFVQKYTLSIFVILSYIPYVQLRYPRGTKQNDNFDVIFWIIIESQLNN